MPNISIFAIPTIAGELRDAINQQRQALEKLIYSSMLEANQPQFRTVAKGAPIKTLSESEWETFVADPMQRYEDKWFYDTPEQQKLKSTLNQLRAAEVMLDNLAKISWTSLFSLLDPRTYVNGIMNAGQNAKSLRELLNLWPVIVELLAPLGYSKDKTVYENLQNRSGCYNNCERELLCARRNGLGSADQQGSFTRLPAVGGCKTRPGGKRKNTGDLSG